MNEHLQHHGILGMKWGVRRYQNKDGSLTRKGRERYSSLMSKGDRTFREEAFKRNPITGKPKGFKKTARLYAKAGRIKGQKPSDIIKQEVEAQIRATHMANWWREMTAKQVIRVWDKKHKVASNSVEIGASAIKDWRKQKEIAGNRELALLKTYGDAKITDEWVQQRSKEIREEINAFESPFYEEDD